MTQLNETKALLQKALRNLPDKFKLSEIKFHINTALYKINDVEHKEQRRDQFAKLEQKRIDDEKELLAKFRAGIVPASGQTLKFLDKLIDEEKAKLKEANKAKKSEPKIIITE